MATKSSVVSGMGVGVSIIQTLVSCVKKAGGSDEDIHRLATPDAEGDGTWQKIAQVIVEAGKKIGQIFTLVVDYGRSVKAGILAGKYDYANDNIAEENFPKAEHEQGKKEQVFTLYHFDKSTESDLVITQMEKDGKRPATLRELISFGEKYPELQRQFPIIALGSVWLDRLGSRRVPYLGSAGSRRDLDLNWYDGSWDGRCRFLAVSK